MRDAMDARDPPRLIGVAGRCSTDEERSYVKQAVFLLRYRIRSSPGHAAQPALDEP